MTSMILRAALAGLVGAAGGLGLAWGAASARPIVPAEREFPLPYSGNVESCADHAVLDSIVERFQIRESEYWSSGLKLLGFEQIRQVGYRTDGYDLVPRRYCEARGVFNDDKYRRVVYKIGEGLGFAGYGFGVQWCVEGLDRNSSFGYDCQAAYP